jgi:hypothetical protein
VLNGAQHIIAMQIANDPTVRDCVRQVFRERAKITCKPTKKGIKVGIIWFVFHLYHECVLQIFLLQLHSYCWIWQTSVLKDLELRYYRRAVMMNLLIIVAE